jgi:hypothetical protein
MHQRAVRHNIELVRFDANPDHAFEYEAIVVISFKKLYFSL